MTRDMFGLENTDEYRKFLRFALKRADSVGASYTSDFSAFKESKYWENLGESVISGEYDERGVLTLRLKIDHAVYDWLREKKNLFDFGDPFNEDILWDLCLYKDGREIFSSITHEGEAYISDELLGEYTKENK